jgi:hypothetical protein
LQGVRDFGLQRLGGGLLLEPGQRGVDVVVVRGVELDGFSLG